MESTSSSPTAPPLPPPVNFQFSASTYNTVEGSASVAVCVDASVLFGRTFQVTVSATPGTATGQWCMCCL